MAGHVLQLCKVVGHDVSFRCKWVADVKVEEFLPRLLAIDGRTIDVGDSESVGTIVLVDAPNSKPYLEAFVWLVVFGSVVDLKSWKFWIRVQEGMRFTLRN